VPPTSRINTLINELTFLLSSSLMRLDRPADQRQGYKQHPTQKYL